ncbi:prolipoprotein diacylglyceryl transferase [Ruminococcus callidus]|uniref:prolipoprotein diacylglyceryl transferase n=1 Tax=Ruminococcus callidus TaxID=40519 RepID=UPI0035201A25
MYPRIHFLNSDISTYLLCTITGFLICYLLLNKLLLERYIFRKYSGAYLLSSIGMLLGAKLFGFISKLLYTYSLEKTLKFEYSLKESGIVYLGGLLGYLVMLKILCFIKDRNWNEISDITAVIVPLFHFFGRIGCFFGGCCYGIESNSCIAIPYRIILKDEQWTNRIPVQLMEAFFELILFVIFYFSYQDILKKQKEGSGRMLLLYLLLYSIWRFVIEFWRGDIERGKIGSLSFSQIISIFILGYILISTCKKWRDSKCEKFYTH